MDLGSHWTLKSHLWGCPEKSLGTPALEGPWFRHVDVKCLDFMCS